MGKERTWARPEYLGSDRSRKLRCLALDTLPYCRDRDVPVLYRQTNTISSIEFAMDFPIHRVLWKF